MGGIRVLLSEDGLWFVRLLVLFLRLFLLECLQLLFQCFLHFLYLTLSDFLLLPLKFSFPLYSALVLLANYGLIQFLHHLLFHICVLI